jgi:hypothetical protein
MAAFHAGCEPLKSGDNAIAAVNGLLVVERPDKVACPSEG